MSIPSEEFIINMAAGQRNGVYVVNATTENGVDHEFRLTQEELYSPHCVGCGYEQDGMKTDWIVREGKLRAICSFCMPEDEE